MKKIISILSVALLLYCFITTVAGTSLDALSGIEATENQELATKKTFLAQTQVDLFFHSSSIHILGQVQRAPLGTSKNPFSHFLLVLQAYEGLFLCAFVHYQNITQNLLIRFRKADLIFPFHYFW